MRKKQLTIYKCGICGLELNSYQKTHMMHITTQTESGGYKSEIACNKCIKTNFLLCKSCGRIVLDLRPHKYLGVIQCPICIKMLKQEDELKKVIEEHDSKVPQLKSTI